MNDVKRECMVIEQHTIHKADKREVTKLSNIMTSNYCHNNVFEEFTKETNFEIKNIEKSLLALKLECVDNFSK